MKGKVTQAHLHAIIARMIGNGVSGRVEGQFGCFLLFSVKNVNDLGPGGFLAVIPPDRASAVAPILGELAPFQRCSNNNGLCRS